MPATTKPNGPGLKYKFKPLPIKYKFYAHVLREAEQIPGEHGVRYRIRSHNLEVQVSWIIMLVEWQWEGVSCILWAQVHFVFLESNLGTLDKTSKQLFILHSEFLASTHRVRIITAQRLLQQLDLSEVKQEANLNVQ